MMEARGSGEEEPNQNEDNGSTAQSASLSPLKARSPLRNVRHSSDGASTPARSFHLLGASQNEEYYNEEASNDDSFAYSDDSESLTDAYFHPQQDIDKPSYGSFSNLAARKNFNQMNQPPILEDSPLLNTSSQTLNHHQPTKNLRFSKKHNKHRRLAGGRRQRIREQRERTVSQVRGELQSPTENHDNIWSWLFLIQLLFVLSCAIRYGWTLVNPADLSADGSAPLASPLTTTGGSIGNQDGRLRSLLEGQGSNYSGSALTATESPKAFNTTSLSAVPKDLENLQDDDTIQAQEHSTSSGLAKKSAASHEARVTDVQSIAKNVPYKNPYFFRIDYRNVISIFTISGFYACVTSYLSFGFMLSVARSMIPIVLIFTIISSFVWGVFGLTFLPNSIATILGCSLFVVSIVYTKTAWRRIPFCSINLCTAMSALRDTSGILLIGIGSLCISFLWLLVWLVAVIGIFNSSIARECQESQMDCHTHIVLEKERYLELFILVFSFVWTCLVIKNVARTAIAGACGAWWFGAHGHPRLCIDSIVWNHLANSCTSSLGSICLGSLLELPVQTILFLGNAVCNCDAFQTDEPPRVTPNSDKLSTINAEKFSLRLWLARRIRCCNRWSYTYVGIYYYSFFQGGEKAYQLFRARGWLPIAKDNLIENTLLMESVVIGCSCGVFAVLVEEVDGYTFTSFHEPILTSFWIGTATGFVLSYILLLGVVSSAVTTILVCFAAEPFEFDKNHPRLSHEMREVWTQLVWEPADSATAEASSKEVVGTTV